MKILLDKITAAGTHFPERLSNNSRHSVSIIAEDDGGDATVTAIAEATPFGRYANFREAADGVRTTFHTRGIPNGVEDEVVVAKDGVVLTSGITVTGHTVEFDDAPAAGSIFSVFLTRAGSWVNVLTVPFTDAGASAFEFSEEFEGFRVRVSVLTTAKVTATLALRNR
jgi:hypothetical protein